MSLATGARLGAYEIVGSIGAGGMGEVYRARDPRLGRDVAIKVLPASFAEDRDRVRRFEKEARAAGALNHPNLVTVFDVGSHDGGPFLVLELLEGSTLSALLAEKPLPVRKALDYAAQIALGLGAAHESGIVHRDLKPANLFVTRDGRLKILDFGLAKAEQALAGQGGGSEAVTASRGTESGAILGTVGYMSPEQVMGKAADTRADIFSFGAVLYEMLSGQRAFRGATTVETLNAILNQDPPELARPDEPVPPTLERIVRRCLEKDPSRRFRSAHDLAFALEALSGSGPVSRIGATARASAWRKPAVAMALVLGGLALLGGAYLAGSRRERPLPSFQRLTFRRGMIEGARFAPDAKTIVYGAEWDGTGPQVFTTRPESPESRALGLPDSRLWAVSSSGELAIEQPWAGGVLAQVSLGGGAPRALLDKVTSADWSPDGTRLAIVRDLQRLEFPSGKAIYQSRRGVYFPRVSPTGDRLAFIESDQSYDASVVVVDLQGTPIVKTRRWKVAEGLAWAPKGDEVWFSASDVGEALTLHAVGLSGRVRQVAGIPGRVALKDISRDGRLLVTRETSWTQIAGVFPGSTLERDLSWLDAPWVGDISADGRTLLFTETGEGGGKTSLVYLRKTDGSPAIRLGEGTALSLSPDGSWAAVQPPNTEGPQVVLLPTGAGEAKQLSIEPLTERGGVSWFPDSKRFVVCGTEPDHKPRCYVVDVETGKARPLTPEGVRGLGPNAPVSPDGRSLLVQDARDPSGEPAPVAVYSIEEGKLRPLRGWNERNRALTWSADGRSILVFRFEWPEATWLERFDLAKGVAEKLRKLTPADRVSAFNLPIPVITPDGRYYAYQQFRTLSDLYLVDGLR